MFTARRDELDGMTVELAFDEDDEGYDGSKKNARGEPSKTPSSFPS